MVLTTQCAEMEREFPSPLLPPLPHCDSGGRGRGRTAFVTHLGLLALHSPSPTPVLTNQHSLSLLHPSIRPSVVRVRRPSIPSRSTQSQSQQSGPSSLGARGSVHHFLISCCPSSSLPLFAPLARLPLIAAADGRPYYAACKAERREGASAGRDGPLNFRSAQRPSETREESYFP